MTKMKKMKTKRRVSFSGSSFSPVGLKVSAVSSRLLTHGRGVYGVGDGYMIDSNNYKVALMIILVVLACCIFYSGVK